MSDEHEKPARRQERRRRAYSPPSILETARFETLALSCGKTTPDVALCIINGLTNS